MDHLAPATCQLPAKKHNSLGHRPCHCIPPVHTYSGDAHLSRRQTPANSPRLMPDSNPTPATSTTHKPCTAALTRPRSARHPMPDLSPQSPIAEHSWDLTGLPLKPHVTPPPPADPGLNAFDTHSLYKHHQGAPSSSHSDREPFLPTVTYGNPTTAPQSSKPSHT
jgi:hypothetical protein